MKKKSLLLLSVFLILLISFSFVLAADKVDRVQRANRVPGEILIGFKPDISPSQIQDIVSVVGGRIAGEIDLPGVKIRRVKLSSTAQSAIDAAIKSVKTDKTFQDKIKYVEPNVIRRIYGDRTTGNAGILSQSSDPLLYDQWGYYDIGANWLNVPTVTTAPIIAEIDTGIDYTHPDLAEKVIKGYDYVNADGDPMDDHGHGTHVAGIAAAKTNNAYGIAGISWYSQILAVKACSSQGLCLDFDTAKGITYAADYPGVKILNMSFGGEYSPPLQDAVEYAVNTKGKLLVAAAGNDGTNDSTYAYPAAFSTTYPGKVLAVAAHGTDHCRPLFSNYGTWVSITAPGVDILSTVPSSIGSSGFESWSGTSMAAAFVSGTAAVVKALNPTLTNVQIANLITTKTKLPGYLLLRDGVCWPNDSSTFQRLDLFHVLEPTYYETASGKGFIYGFALDAETGEPLTGAKVIAKQGTTLTGKDYVPYYGERTDFYPNTIALEGYGLFSVLTATGENTLKLKKTGYAIPKFTGMTVSDDSGTYAGSIPVPPNQKKYWLAVTWDYGTFCDPITPSGTCYDSYYCQYPDYNWCVGYFDGPGDLNEEPWAKWLWDSDYGESNLRDFSEVIRVKKMLTGDHLFYVEDWSNGFGSTSWASSGIKAYIFKWNPLTLSQELVATFEPDLSTGTPPGSGQFWDICTINGGTITEINNLTDD